MRTGLIAIIAIMFFAGCSGNGDQADAYGTFEATEVIVSAETSGRILKFDVAKGSDIAKGDQIALIDTTMFHLQKDEIDAGIKSISTRIGSVNAQNDILNQQITNLNVNIERIENMLKNDAATQKQYDDLIGQRAVLQKQIMANSTQKALIESEISVYKTRRATINEQINRSSVKSPLKGTVIEKYSEEGELTGAGRSLVKIANLSVMRIKVYVSGAQLGSIKLGGECTVRVDDGDTGYKTFQGTITHIAEKAEFTPKIIQTKEERVTLVYAVTIDVANDGTMKSGMPGEAIF